MNTDPSTAWKKALEEKVAELEKIKEALLISERRCEIAMKFSDITMFEYDPRTKRIVTQYAGLDGYGVFPGVLEGGMESTIDSGMIAEESKEAFRALYQEIDAGAPSSAATIHTKDLAGNIRTLELRMINIFDQAGRPVYALGVRKDITDAVQFHKEKEYGELLASERTLIYEANFTQDKILHYDARWAKEGGLGDPTTLSALLRTLCRRYIAPEHQALFFQKQSNPFILSAFQSGERVVSFEYRKLVSGKGYLWYEMRLNMIEDRPTGDIHMRAYILDINSKKEKKLKARAERKRYETMLARSVTVYEANITKNRIILGQKEVWDAYGVLPGECALDSILPTILAAIHPHDRVSLASMLSRANLLGAYANGKAEVTGEYRRMEASGRHHWYRCSLQLFEDSSTGDVLGYAYIEDIHAEKERELALLYSAQHDSMTDFYNKNVVAEKIDELLSSGDGMFGLHLFFIIDLDYFKLINDHFGHAFGDAVLSQTAGRIRSLFRECDILGRIGGDEFVVFMRDVPDTKMAALKAQEICDSVSNVYMQNGIAHRVTVSIGIAVYDSHGRTYDELYRHSDTALYHAKAQGRNCFFMYNKDIQVNRSASNEIEPRLIQGERTFAIDVNTYVFRILYEATDKRRAINTVLELMGKHYHVSRAYVFENSSDGRYTSNTFEWCNAGIAPQMEELQRVPYSVVQASFNAEGIFYMPDIRYASGAVKEILEPQGVQSMLVFQILKNGKPVGSIGFDECTCIRVPEDQELRDFRNFSNVLGVFIMEMRAFERGEASRNMALSVVNGLDSYTYVCDPLTHQLLFINDKTLGFVPDAKVGDCCYKALWGKTAPCRVCPMNALAQSGDRRHVSVRYNRRLGIWAKVTASWINWLEDKKDCLVDIMDITEFRKDMGEAAPEGEK